MNEPNPPPPNNEKRFPEMPPPGQTPVSGSTRGSAPIKRNSALNTILVVLLVLLIGIPLGLAGMAALVLGACLLGNR